MNEKLKLYEEANKLVINKHIENDKLSSLINKAMLEKNNFSDFAELKKEAEKTLLSSSTHIESNEREVLIKIRFIEPTSDYDINHEKLNNIFLSKLKISELTETKENEYKSTRISSDYNSYEIKYQSIDKLYAEYAYIETQNKILETDIIKYSNLYNQIKEGIAKLISGILSNFTPDANDIVKNYLDAIIEEYSGKYFKKICDQWMENHKGVPIIEFIEKNNVVTTLITNENNKKAILIDENFKMEVIKQYSYLSPIDIARSSIFDKTEKSTGHKVERTFWEDLFREIKKGKI